MDVIDLVNLNIKYLSGELNEINYCSEKIKNETKEIVKELIELNKREYLTVESQPGFNDINSKQKPYIKFYTKKENINKITNFITQDKNYKIVIHFYPFDSHNILFSNIRNYVYPLTIDEGEIFTAVSNETVNCLQDFKFINEDYISCFLFYNKYENFNLFKEFLDFIDNY
jgi:hypothetical protein